MSLPRATRRPIRVAAAALLLLIHLAVVVALLRQQATRERPGEGMVTLFLDAPPQKHETQALPSPAPRKPPTVAPAALPADDLAHAIHGEAEHGETAAPGLPAAATTAATAASAPLKLAIPREFFTHPPPLTVAQEAMQDPRSNRLVLTKQEQLDVDFGAVECIAWQRQADGSIYRGPGHYQRIQGVSTNPFTKHKPGYEDRGMECVK